MNFGVVNTPQRRTIRGPLIRAAQIRKTYFDEDAKKPSFWNRKKEPIPGVEVLKGIDLDIFAGDKICIMGSSGAGKSTLLHILGALDRPSSGKVLFEGKDMFSMSEDQLSEFRNKQIGFVFQFHHLLSDFTALENVMMPSLIAGSGFRESRKQAELFLADLGLRDRLHHRPSEMSGGEQQRVAIARALVRRPSVIFADEPTGNLDQKTGQQVQSLLFDIQNKYGLTLIAVSHDMEFSRKFPRVLTLRDGQWF